MVNLKFATHSLVAVSLLLLIFNNCSSGFNAGADSQSSKAAIASAENTQPTRGTSPGNLPGLPLLVTPSVPPQMTSFKTVYACNENIVISAKGMTSTLKGCDQKACYAELASLASSAELGNGKWTHLSDGSYSFTGRNTNTSASDIIQLWAVEDDFGHKSTVQAITMKACSTGSTGGGSNTPPSSPLTPPPATTPPPTNSPSGKSCSFNIKDYNKYGLTEFMLVGTRTTLSDKETIIILSPEKSSFVDLCVPAKSASSGYFAADSRIFSNYQAYDANVVKSAAIYCSDGKVDPPADAPYIVRPTYVTNTPQCPSTSQSNICSVVNQSDQFTSYYIGDSVSSFQLNISNGGFNPDNLETYFACRQADRVYKVMRGYNYICSPTGGAAAALQKNGFTYPEIMDQTAYLQNLNPLGTPDISSYPTCESKGINVNDPYKISREQDRSGNYSASNGHTLYLNELYREGKIILSEDSGIYQLDHMFLETEKNSDFLKSYKGRGIEFPTGCYQAAPYSAQAIWTSNTTLQITKTYLEKSCGLMRGATATITLKK